MPSSSLAMKPWVISDGARALSCASSAASGAKLQIADSMLGLGGAAALRSARSMVRASAQAASSPCVRRKRAPSSVAMSSPLAMTRARVRSLTSRTSATPAAISRSSAKWRSTSSPSAMLSSAASCRWRSSMAQLLFLRLADGGIEQPLQAVGDAGDGRVHDQHARTGAHGAAAMRAILFQLASVETLVPPNFRTIQAEGGVT